MIVLIDNKSYFFKEIVRVLKKQKIEFKVVDHSKVFNAEKFGNVDGVILTGASIGLKSNLSADYIALFSFDVPIIGFCLGHEIIAKAFGGAVKRLSVVQNKKQKVLIKKLSDPIFKGLKKNVYLREAHHKFVSRLPDGFKILASSDAIPIEVMRHNFKKIYGFQSHPEASGKNGEKILQNFLTICGYEIQKL